MIRSALRALRTLISLHESEAGASALSLLHAFIEKHWRERPTYNRAHRVGQTYAKSGGIGRSYCAADTERFYKECGGAADSPRSQNSTDSAFRLIGCERLHATFSLLANKRNGYASVARAIQPTKIAWLLQIFLLIFGERLCSCVRN